MSAAPKLVGVLNVTPDSFSDGEAMTPPSVLAKAETLLEGGAQVLDVGAESTRPGATPLSPEEEWARLEPVWGELVAMCRNQGVTLSLDTRHAETAKHALALGCDWINDVSGFSEAMLDAVRTHDCKLVVMHSLSVPAKKGEAVDTDDIVAFMREWCQQMQVRLMNRGIARERIIVDPGIGFGKSARQSWELLARLREWKSESPVLIGHSRKSFLSLFTDAPAQDRDALTRAISAMLATQGADYLRVHDVAGHRHMFEEFV